VGEQETVEVLKDSAEEYRYTLGGKLQAKKKATLSEPYNCEPSPYFNFNYQQLCKGETVIVCLILPCRDLFAFRNSSVFLKDKV